MMITKGFTITVILVLLTLLLSTQNRDDTKQIYTMALTAHIAGIAKSVKSIEERKVFGEDTFFIEKDFLIELPAKIGGHVIQVIGDSVRQMVSPTRSIFVVKLNPIRLDRGQIMVVLGNYNVVSAGQVARFILMGGTAYKFRYDSTDKQYRLVKTWSVDF